MNRLKYFLINGTLITIVTLFLRTVSVAFNVYISNKIGAVAMGLFGLISTVYGFALTVATSGINLATTRLVSEAKGENSSNLCGRLKLIIKKSVSYALFFGLFSAIALFIFAEPIGVKALGDARTVLSLKILAITLPFIAVSSVLGGYFTAIRKVYKNAIVQVLGQFIRIYFCTLLFSSLGANDVESSCLAIVIGGAVSEVISFLIQYFLYVFDKNYDARVPSFGDGKAIKRKILGITLPVACSAYLRSGLVTLEHLLIPWGLKKSGSSQEKSLASYGTVHSMVFPLVLFPSAISSSFAGLLIPEMAEANAGENLNRIKRIAEIVFKMVLMFAIGTAGLIMCFSYELGETFYPDTGASKYILMVAPLIPVMYLDTSVDSMLKGLGKQTYTMLINVIDATLSVILVIVLLPKFGIDGFIITVYFTEIINATLSIVYLLNVCNIKVKIYEWVIKPVFCVLIATTAIRSLLSMLSVFASTKAETLFHIAVGACVYLLLLFVTKAIKVNDLKATLKRLMEK